MPNQITITGGGTTVTMPRTREIEWQDVEVSRETEMASGLRVKDVLGYRPTLTARWDYIPADVFLALKTLLRRGGYYTVTYPADGADKTGQFAVTASAATVFAFRSGVAVWHDVTLTLESAEVLT